ncbi:hypothetical protein DFH28DRAFT_1199408 [Melampsora americana]|nr:hypothetical protein DFH28DRAFT_1199408 [Melampsora americana]
MFQMFSIAALERAAALFPSQSSQSQSNPTQTQPSQQLTDDTNALSLSNQTDNRFSMNSFINANTVNLRASNADTSSSDVPISKDRMMSMSSNELRCLAEKNANRGINKDQMERLIEFHETQQHALAMMAVELGISVSAIEAMWGRRIAVRIATAWNRYLQTHHAKALFKTYGGISNGVAMSELSFAWKHMSPEEKAAFKAPIPDVDLNFGDKVVSNKRARQIVQPRTLVKSNPTSLQKSERQVQSYLTDLIAKATPIAASCNCEFVFFAVSKHLAAHSFQIRVVTPGAQRGVELITEAAGTQEFGAQLQGYVTGNTTEAVQAKRHCGGNSKVVRKEVTARLGRLLAERSQSALNKWPWSDADTVLATFNLRMVLTRPGSTLDINCLKRPLSQLSGPDSRKINYELDQGGISLLPLQSESESTSVTGTA